MKYLFFDIECSNCYGGVGKICEYGYVLIDSNFNVLRKDAIPMSPGKGRQFRFDVKIYEREKGFQWAYDFDTYFSCEEFPYFYEQIRKLMEDEDTIVLGYSVLNDIQYLGKTCVRYNLDTIKFDAYDAQKIMRMYLTNEHRCLSLSNAFAALCDKNELIKIQPHLSRDDAYMTMRLVQNICSNLKLTLDELLELCSNAKQSSSNFNKNLHSHNSDDCKIKNHHISNKNQVLRGNTYRLCENKLNNPAYIGKIITISSKIKEDDLMCEEICKSILENDLIAYDGISGSDFLVCVNEEDVTRMKNILKKPYGGSIITFDEFKSKIKDSLVS